MTQIPTNQQFVMPFIVDAPQQFAGSAAPPQQQQFAPPPQQGQGPPPPQQQQLPPPPNPLAPPDPTKTGDPQLDSILNGQQTPPPNVQGDLVKLGKVFGVDVSKFQNPADAQQALRILSERYIQNGLNPQAPKPPGQPVVPQQQQPPQQQQRQQPPRAEDTFDYNGVDPVVAQRLRALEAEVATSRQETAQFREQQQAAEQSKFHEARAEVRTRANRALDSLQNATFGVGGNQTLQQQFARRSFLDMTEKMIIGMAESNTLNSTIEDIVLSMAYLANGAQAPQQQQQQQQPQQNQFYQQQYVDPASQYGTVPQQSYQPQFQQPNYNQQFQAQGYPYGQGPGQAAPQQFQYPQQPQLPPGYQSPSQFQAPPRIRDEAEKLKQDAHFMAGARAILSRSR